MRIINIFIMRSSNINSFGLYEREKTKQNRKQTKQNRNIVEQTIPRPEFAQIKLE